VSEREEEVLDHLAKWAAEQELVRALVLESSRANGATLDIFSDFDVLLVVTDPCPFVESDAWLADFAPPLVMFRDAMRTWEHETIPAWCSMRMAPR
jgi:Streptomycin adenylyltransferase